MPIFNFLNGIETKIKIRNVLNKLLRIVLIELLLFINNNSNVNIQKKVYFLVNFFSIILIEEK
jgi:hypothetical protein